MAINISRKAVVSAASLIACAGLFSRVNDAYAAALQIAYVDTITDAPTGQIGQIAQNFRLDHAASITCSGDFKESTGWYYHPDGEGTRRKKIISVPYANAPVHASGQVKVWYENAATDIDGSPLDVELIAKDVYLSEHFGDGHADNRVTVLQTELDYPNNRLLVSVEYPTIDTNASPGMRCRIHVRYLRHNTSELAHGKTVLRVDDIDSWHKKAPDWPETFRFISGFKNRIYVQRDNRLSIGSDYVTARDLSVPEPAGSRRCSAVIECEPEYEFEWTGHHCGSALFSNMYPPKAKLTCEKQAHQLVYL